VSDIPLHDKECTDSNSMIQCGALYHQRSCSHTLVKAKQLKGQVSKQAASTTNCMYIPQRLKVRSKDIYNENKKQTTRWYTMDRIFSL